MKEKAQLTSSRSIKRRAQDATQSLMTESMIEKADEAMDVMELERAATDQLSTLQEQSQVQSSPSKPTDDFLHCFAAQPIKSVRFSSFNMDGRGPPRPPKASPAPPPPPPGGPQAFAAPPYPLPPRGPPPSPQAFAAPPLPPPGWPSGPPPPPQAFAAPPLPPPGWPSGPPPPPPAFAAPPRPPPLAKGAPPPPPSRAALPTRGRGGPPPPPPLLASTTRSGPPPPPQAFLDTDKRAAPPPPGAPLRSLPPPPQPDGGRQYISMRSQSFSKPTNALPTAYGRLSSSAPRPKARYSRGIDDSTLERSEDAVISEQRDSSRASVTTSALSAGTSAFFRKKVAGKVNFRMKAQEVDKKPLPKGFGFSSRRGQVAQPPPPPPPPPSASVTASARNGRGKSGRLEKADRGSLLASIRSGKKLAKVEVEKAIENEVNEPFHGGLASALSRRLRAIRVHGGDRGGGGGGVDGDSDDDWDESDEWSESEGEEMGFDLFGDTELLSDKVTKEAVPVSGKRSTTTKISDSDIESIFLAQQQDGSWALNDIYLVKLNVSRVNEILQQAGAKSLGTTVYTALCSLLATLLVLKQLSKQLPSIFSSLQFSPKLRIGGHVESRYLPAVQRAVDYATKKDALYPSLYSRLDLGHSWDDALNDIVSKC